MLSKTTRWTFELSSSGATAPRMPEIAVMMAIPTPRTIGIQNGLKRTFGLVAMVAKATAKAGWRPTSEAPRRSVGDGFGVRLGQTSRHRGQQLVGQTAHLVEEATELTLAEHEEPQIGVSDHGGVPGPADEESEFAEVLT